MDINTARNRREVYAAAKEAGVVIPSELKKQLTLGGLRDYVRKNMESN